MKDGIVKGVPAPSVLVSHPADNPPHSPDEYVLKALRQLEIRESEIATDMERLERLHREMTQVVNAKAILQDALARLKLPTEAERPA
jgi:hypothetical protein